MPAAQSTIGIWGKDRKKIRFHGELSSVPDKKAKIVDAYAKILDSIILVFLLQ